MALARLDYPFDIPTGTSVQTNVAPGIRWLRMPLPFALDHINLWLIDEADGLSVVDTGLGDDATRTLWTGLLKGLPPLRQIVATHFHPDHLGNAAWLAQRSGAVVAMSLGEYLQAHAVHGQSSGYDLAAMLAHFRRHGLDEARLEKLAARGNVYARGVPELPTQIRRIVDGDSLLLGGERWLAIAGYGHSPEHIALYCAARGVLISGDMLLPRITTNVSVAACQPEEDAVNRFLQSIRRFGGLPADTLVLPSHGKPFRGLHQRIAQLEAHHAARDELVLQTLVTPHTAAELLPVLFARELDAHQLMFAMGEAIAHLNQLWHEGRLVRHEEAQTLRFVRR